MLSGSWWKLFEKGHTFVHDQVPRCFELSALAAKTCFNEVLGWTPGFLCPFHSCWQWFVLGLVVGSLLTAALERRLTASPITVRPEDRKATERKELPIWEEYIDDRTYLEERRASPRQRSSFPSPVLSQTLFQVAPTKQTAAQETPTLTAEVDDFGRRIVRRRRAEQ